MANKKTTDLTLLNAVPATNDIVPIVDVSDTTDSANGTTKKITTANLVKLLVNGLTGVLRADSGVVSVDTDVTDLVSDGSETVAGKYEEATDAEVTAGTATGGTGAKLVVTPAKLATRLTYLQTKFGGTGADGALTITSGTTTLDCGNAQVFVKNYSSISITGTGKLAFSNPHANGTTIILLCTGDVTITSSTVPAIDASSMGAAGGTGTLDTAFVDGNPGYGFLQAYTNHSTNNSGGATATADFVNPIASVYAFLAPHSCPGAGGASGGGGKGTASSYTPGSGGRGGGVLIISCLGAYNVTSTLSVAGGAGSNGARTGSESTAGGGGGGSGGQIFIYYGSLTTDSGTYTVSGGAGGSGTSSNNVGATNSGAGGAGSVKVAGSNGSGGCSGPDSGCNGGAGAAGLSKINV